MKGFFETVFVLAMIVALFGMICLCVAVVMLPIVMSALIVASAILLAAQHGSAEYAIAMLAGMVAILFAAIELHATWEEERKR